MHISTVFSTFVICGYKAIEDEQLIILKEMYGKITYLITCFYLL